VRQRGRKDKNLPLREVSEQIPMKKYALNKIELGYVSCKLTTLKLIADVLSVDIKTFYNLVQCNQKENKGYQTNHQLGVFYKGKC